MMTRTEHLLIVLSEECAEVAQRVSKALRFGLEDREPDQPHSNSERIARELDDLCAVVDMLREIGTLRSCLKSAVDAKKARVRTYERYAIACGTLEPEA